MNNREITKVENEKQKYKKHCEFCGHTISFYAFERDKKICSYCGRYNYRNNLIKFKDKLNRLLNKCELRKNGC